MYQQAEQMLHDDIARLWVDHYNTPLILSSKKVSGYIPQPVGADYLRVRRDRRSSRLSTQRLDLASSLISEHHVYTRGADVSAPLSP